MDGHLKIPPCVLQDIGPLGPLPCSHSTSSLDHYQQGIGYRWPCAILGWLVVYESVLDGALGADGGWLPLPTRLQRYCDPTSLVCSTFTHSLPSCSFCSPSLIHAYWECRVSWGGWQPLLGRVPGDDNEQIIPIKHVYIINTFLVAVARL